MRVYLDHNATSPLRPEAREAMLSAMNAGGNASSVHAEGRNARQSVETARATLAEFFGAAPEDVIFTSGGTEANTLAIMGTLNAAAVEGQRFTRLLVSAVEHDSVLATASRSAELNPGLKTTILPVTSQGTVCLESLNRALAEGKGRALVSIMTVNSETGVIQPIAEAAELCARYGAQLHTDAVQALGKVPVDFAHSPASLITISAHKIGGPQGAGAIVKRASAKLAPLVHGGKQEFGYRAGTENVPAIAGFGASIAALSSVTSKGPNHGLFEKALKAACPDAVIIAETAQRTANTTYISVPGVSAETLVIALDLDGFAVSAGSACSSGKVSQSHVLRAMGIDDALAKCAIRISSGWNTTAEQLMSFVPAWKHVIERVRAREAA